MKKRILILSLLVVCLSLCIGGTLAYFTASEAARNVITAGNIKIKLIETDAEGKPFKNVSGVMPGAEVAKVVSVRNTGDAPCWVRVRVDKEIILAEGQDGEPDLSYVGIDFDTKEWKEAEDGFFYYRKVLDVNAETKPLFKKVNFDQNLGNMYQGCTANINVTAYAVQSDNNGRSVFEADGWLTK